MSVQTTGKSRYRCDYLKVSLVCIVTCIVSSQRTSAALFEHTVTIDPAFEHESYFDSSFGFRRVESEMIVPVPDVTLAPGDTHRVTVEFANGKYLKLRPTPTGGVQSFDIEQFDGNIDGSVGRVASGADSPAIVTVFDGGLQEVDRQEFDIARIRANFIVDEVWSLLNGIRDHYQDHEPLRYNTIRKIVFEVTAPQEVVTYNATFPYETTTFDRNEIIFQFSADSPGDGPAPSAVFVVPEPTAGMLLLLALSPVANWRNR